MKAKYFKETELACPCCGRNFIDGGFLTRIDRLREKVGEPLIINSACRCSKHNEKVGGNPESSHLKGLAVDIKCEDNQLRFKIIKYWLQITQVYLKPSRIEIGANYIHIDEDKTKFNEIIWFNKSNFKKHLCKGA